MGKVEELEAQLEAARREEREARERLAQSVTPIWKYTVERSHDAYTLSGIYDEAVLAYRVKGECLNREDCLLAGRSERELAGGGMTWLFNTATGRLICDNGGGTVYFGFSGENSEEQLAAVEEISAFISAYPQGGEITGIIEKYRAARREKHGM